MTPRISVLIDTYNHEKYIEQCVASAVEQDFPAGDYEIVVVDDGSTDRTPDIVRKFAPRVRLVQKKNGGQASAFNAGIAETRGEFVAFLDGDDYWLPGKLSRVVQEFERHPEAGMVYHRLFDRTEGTGEVREAQFVPVSGDVAKDASVARHYRAYPTSSLTFRRSLLQRFYPIPEEIRLQTDAYIGLLAPVASPIRAIPEPLAVYRLHGENLFSGSLTRERRQSHMAMRKLVLDGVNRWLEQHAIDPRSPAVHALLERHYLYCQDMAFGLEPPGRWQFFRFQLKKNRLNRDVCGPKLRAINWFNAVASLATGYEGFHALEGWWLRLDQKKDQLFSVRP